MTPLRCVLFFPATRPDRYEKALASGVDAVCVDLEDAVALDDKDRGRAEAVVLLEAREPCDAATIVRVNAYGSPFGRADLEALCAASAAPDAIMLPKVDGPEDVLAVEGALQEGGLRVPLIPMIETARGLAAVEEIATCSSSSSALLFGGVDLSTELGASIGWDELLYARSRVVHAVALGGIDAIDMPFLDVSSAEDLEAEAVAVKRLGFIGKAAIHPSQVGIIQERFAPSEDEIARARMLIDAYQAEGGNAFLLDGVMVDRPVIEAARKILTRIPG
jgi:(S)-citramalyl-CoA lyase